MCFGCSKEPSHRNGETVLLSTQDKCLLRNQVICQLRILIIWRSDNLQWRYCNGDSSEPFVVVLRSSLFKILKYFKAIRRRAMLSFGVLVEDLLGKFMYISQFRRYAQLSSGTRDILLLPPLHTRRRTSNILNTLFQGQNRAEVYFSLCICAV